MIVIAAGCREAFLRRPGADAVINYTATAIEEVVHNLNLVINTPGRPASSHSLRTLRYGDALYPTFPLGFVGAGEARQRGVTVSTAQVRSSGVQSVWLAGLLDAGAIRMTIDSVLPLAQAQMAHERVVQDRLQGKVVLSVMSSSAE